VSAADLNLHVRARALASYATRGTRCPRRVGAVVAAVPAAGANDCAGDTPASTGNTEKVESVVLNALVLWWQACRLRT
jgi:hypothetical protein